MESQIFASQNDRLEKTGYSENGEAVCKLTENSKQTQHISSSWPDGRPTDI